MKHTTKTYWVKEMQFNSELPEGEVDYDANEESNAVLQGISPKTSMLSSLAGCTGMDIVSILKKVNHSLDYKLKIEVDGVLTDSHPKIYKKIEIRYYFSGPKLERDKIEKAVHLSITKYCGVLEMFRAFAEVKHFINYN